MSGYGHASHPRLSEGSATETVYGLIRDGKHEECARYLEAELANAPTSRPALSLLGYCHYYLGNFDAAASYYERLCRAHPGNDAYRLHHAQSLFKASAYPEALRATKQIEDPTLAERVAQLQAAIDLTGARRMTPTSPSTSRAACSRRASSRRRAPSSRTHSRRSGTRLIWRTTSRCVTTA